MCRWCVAPVAVWRVRIRPRKLRRPPVGEVEGRTRWERRRALRAYYKSGRERHPRQYAPPPSPWQANDVPHPPRERHACRRSPDMGPAGWAPAPFPNPRLYVLCHHLPSGTAGQLLANPNRDLRPRHRPLLCQLTTATVLIQNRTDSSLNR